MVLSTLIFSLQGFDLVSSLGLAVGTFSSTGNVVASTLVAPAEQWPSDSALLTVAGFGLLARIELLVVLAAFGRSKW
jgi:hypothetical protein